MTTKTYTIIFQGMEITVPHKFSAGHRLTASEAEEFSMWRLRRLVNNLFATAKLNNLTFTYEEIVEKLSS